MLDEDWANWSQCSATCHGQASDAKSTRSRVANNPNCSNYESEECTVEDCPYWIWGEWSTCSGLCGHQTRTRTAESCSNDEGSGEASGAGSGESSGGGSGEGSGESSGDSSSDTTDCDSQPDTETEDCEGMDCKIFDHIMFDIDPNFLAAQGFAKMYDLASTDYVIIDPKERPMMMVIGSSIPPEKVIFLLDVVLHHRIPFKLVLLQLTMNFF